MCGDHAFYVTLSHTHACMHIHTYTVTRMHARTHTHTHACARMHTDVYMKVISRNQARAWFINKSEARNIPTSWLSIPVVIHVEFLRT